MSDKSNLIIKKIWANCSAMPPYWKCSEQQIYTNPKLSYHKLLNQEILEMTSQRNIARSRRKRSTQHSGRWSERTCISRSDCALRPVVVASEDQERRMLAPASKLLVGRYWLGDVTVSHWADLLIITSDSMFNVPMFTNRRHTLPLSNLLADAGSKLLGLPLLRQRVATHG